MFAAGPSGTKLSSLVTRAIRPGYGALGGSDLSGEGHTDSADDRLPHIQPGRPARKRMPPSSGGRGTTRPFGLMLLTFPNGRG